MRSAFCRLAPGPNAAPSGTDVDLDEAADLDARRLRGSRKVIDIIRIVDTHHDPRRLCHLGPVPDLALVDDLVGYQNVIHAGRHARLRPRHPPGPGE